MQCPENNQLSWWCFLDWHLQEQEAKQKAAAASEAARIAAFATAATNNSSAADLAAAAAAAVSKLKKVIEVFIAYQFKYYVKRISLEMDPEGRLPKSAKLDRHCVRL
jgi:hypothetical protein